MWYYTNIRVLSLAWHTRYRHIFVSHGRLWKYKNSGGINRDLLYFTTNRNVCHFSEWVASTKFRKVLNPQVCCKNYLWSQSKKRTGHVENVLKILWFKSLSRKSTYEHEFSDFQNSALETSTVLRYCASNILGLHSGLVLKGQISNNELMLGNKHPVTLCDIPEKWR